MSDYPEYVPEPQEKGLSFTEWISKKYGTGQYNMIQKEVRKVIMTESENGNICPAEWENRLTNALSWCGEEKASNQLSTLVACLSAQIGKTEKETCDLINQCMQSFDLLMEKIKDLAERLKDIFDIAESDICESCEAKRTKHGSSCIAESVYDTTGAINYDGMPHGSNTSDSTALLAIKIAGTDTAERIKELKGRIQELKKLRTEISKEIYSLTPIHKAIICGFYLQGQKWERIAEQISYSVRQSKNIRCVALEVLGGKLARNRNISRSKILKEVLH